VIENSALGFSLDFVFTFQVTPDSILGHFSRFFQRLTKSTDFWDRWHKHAEPAFR